MNAIVNNSTKTMSSREIADLCSARHNDVIATIERLFEKGLLRESRKTLREYISPNGGRPTMVYDLTKNDSLKVVSGYNDETRSSLIDRWAELEEQVASELISLPNFADPVEAARAWADQVEAKRLACKERDYAIETKAHISDKKTATAMATASVKSKEAEKLKEQLGESKNYASVKAVESKVGGKYNWRELKKWCVANGKKIKDIADSNYGTVKIYHKDAWNAVYGIKLMDLFGT